MGKIDNGWEHWLMSHTMDAPTPVVIQGAQPENYWLTYYDETLYLNTICDNCGFVIQKPLDYRGAST